MNEGIPISGFPRVWEGAAVRIQPGAESQTICLYARDVDLLFRDIRFAGDDAVVVLELESRRKRQLRGKTHVRPGIESFLPKHVLRDKRDIHRFEILCIGMPPQNKRCHRLHLCHDLISESIFQCVPGIARKIGEEGSVINPKVGDARLHGVSCHASHIRQEFVTAAVPVLCECPRVDFIIGLSLKLTPEVFHLPQSFVLSHRDLVGADNDRAVQRCHRECDCQ